MTVFFQELAVRSLRPLTAHISLLQLSAPKLAQEAEPGQFLMIRPLKAQEPLLPRPFSIHRVRGDRLEVLFKVVGPGTRRLAECRKGDMLEVRGPLGQGFRLGAVDDLVLVAGGMGVAPLLFAAEFWKKSLVGKKGGRVRVFLGARTRDELLCWKEFQRLGAQVFIATDDGSTGEKGPITHLLKKVIGKETAKALLLACGPPAMLRSVQHWTKEKGISCQLSLETRMACGLGACLGCVTAREKGSEVTYVNVCQEGPVFDAREVVFDDRT